MTNTESQPAGGNWPETDLERPGKCPVCGAAERTVLYEALTDRVFFCAPGAWTLQKCGGCGSAYLDPRPTPQTIGRAYAKYFTHEAGSPKVSFLKRIKISVLNGYLNRTWGTSISPASRTLSLLLPPAYKTLIDGEVMRNLPRPAGGRRVLDVGCGSGEFLLNAQSAGWRVAGFDLDPKAVETARAKGLDVRLGGIEAFAGEADCFDAITVSHVVEHVYEPQGLLAGCRRLLKPGGYFWIETPNIDSYGHAEFKGDWLDLDPPRHLAIQNWEALQRLLAAAGFSDISPLAWRPQYEARARASQAIGRGQNPLKTRPTLAGKIKARAVEAKNKTSHARREFITLKATKPMRDGE